MLRKKGVAHAVIRRQHALTGRDSLFLLRPHFKRLRRENLVTLLIFAAENDPAIRNRLSILLFVIQYEFFLAIAKPMFLINGIDFQENH